MTPEELQQCVEEAFGGLEPPYFQELTRSFGMDLDFEEAVRTDTARTKRWQELRPLTQYLRSSLNILLLTPEACQYYLPAFLYAMTDPENVWRYLSPVLDTLWYEDEDGHASYDSVNWEQLASLLTDRQKHCIAHCLVEILKSAGPIEDCAEVHMETDRIEHMLERYWNAWL